MPGTFADDVTSGSVCVWGGWAFLVTCQIALVYCSPFLILRFHSGVHPSSTILVLEKNDSHTVHSVIPSIAIALVVGM